MSPDAGAEEAQRGATERERAAIDRNVRALGAKPGDAVLHHAPLEVVGSGVRGDDVQAERLLLVRGDALAGRKPDAVGAPHGVVVGIDGAEPERVRRRPRGRAGVAHGHRQDVGLPGDHRRRDVLADERGVERAHAAHRDHDVGTLGTEPGDPILHHPPLEVVHPRGRRRLHGEGEGLLLARSDGLAGCQADAIGAPRRVVVRVDRAEPIQRGARPARAARVAHGDRHVGQLSRYHRRRDGLRDEGGIASGHRDDDVGALDAEPGQTVLHHAPLEVVVARVGRRGDDEVERLLLPGGDRLVAGETHAVGPPVEIVIGVDRSQPVQRGGRPRRPARVPHRHRHGVLLPAGHRRRHRLRDERRVRDCRRTGDPPYTRDPHRRGSRRRAGRRPLRRRRQRSRGRGRRSSPVRRVRQAVGSEAHRRLRLASLRRADARRSGDEKDEDRQRCGKRTGRPLYACGERVKLHEISNLNARRSRRPSLIPWPRGCRK